MTNKSSGMPYDLPWPDAFAKGGSHDEKTPLIYYGGKSRDADWIISHFPVDYATFVDCFGGGGAISFRLRHHRGRTYVYNDIGNVSCFMRVLRDHGDELYRRLYFTPFSRKEFELCRDTWQSFMSAGDEIEWARRWFVVINQGYTHEEGSDTWHVAKQVNSAQALANHVDDLPKLAAKMRKIHVESRDYKWVIENYDSYGALFYLDPPYITSSRVSHNTYTHEMEDSEHVTMCEMLQKIKGQAVVSGYDNPIYSEHLRDWRTVRVTHKSAIQNTKQMKDRDTRTEVLWIKEHNHDLWSTQRQASTLAGV